MDSITCVSSRRIDFFQKNNSYIDILYFITILLLLRGDHMFEPIFVFKKREILFNFYLLSASFVFFISGAYTPKDYILSAVIVTYFCLYQLYLRKIRLEVFHDKLILWNGKKKESEIFFQDIHSIKYIPGGRYNNPRFFSIKLINKERVDALEEMRKDPSVPSHILAYFESKDSFTFNEEEIYFSMLSFRKKKNASLLLSVICKWNTHIEFDSLVSSMFLKKK